MICPHCFEHLQMTRHTMKVMMHFHLDAKQCLDNIAEQTIEEKFHSIEIKLRQAQIMMESLFPDFNSVPNAERFIVSCLKANESLRQMQRGNQETVDKYWRDE